MAASVIAVALVLGGCETSESAGRTWSIAAEPVVSIGETVGADEYLFEAVLGARFLPDGGIAVADRGVPEVRVFEADGAFRASVGRQGEGPGEFANILGLWVTPAGETSAWDPGNRRITTLDHDVRLVSTSPINGQPDPMSGNLEAFLGTYANGDLLLASLFVGDMEREAVPDRWELRRYAANGSFQGGAGRVRGMWRFERRPIPFSPMPYVAVQRDTIYVADGFEPRVEVRDAAGSPIRTIEIPLPPALAVSAIWTDFETLLRERAEVSDFHRILLDLLEETEVPERGPLPTIGGLLVDDEGLLWVKAYDPLRDATWLRYHSTWPGPGGEWWVVRADDGERVATVQMPDDLIPLEVNDDRVLGLAMDELEVQRVVVYPLTRGDG